MQGGLLRECQNKDDGSSRFPFPVRLRSGTLSSLRRERNAVLVPEGIDLSVRIDGAHQQNGFVLVHPDDSGRLNVLSGERREPVVG